MPEFLTITSDGVLEAVRDKLDSVDEWMPGIIAPAMDALGDAVVDVMYTLVEPNRYTGALQESIKSEYDMMSQEVAIYPDATRGDWDAGTLLELGTGPIPNAPWAPIKAWADFRGLPAFPIWWSIREHGVKPHPFLQRTLDDMRTQTAMVGTVTRIVTDMGLVLAATALEPAAVTGGAATLDMTGIT